MILLPEQFQLCLLHLGMGWTFGLLFSFENALRMACFRPFTQKLIEFLFFTAFTLGFYLTLYFLNGGMTHPYCLILFCFGVYLYLKFYLMTFSPLIQAAVQGLLFFQKKLTLAISRCLAIMDVRQKQKKWRNHLGKKKRKYRRNQKKNAEKTAHPNL